MIETISDLAPVSALLAPISSAVSFVVARLRGTAERVRLDAMTALAAQLTGTSCGGQITYRTRGGAELTFTVAAPTGEATSPGARTRD